MSSWSQGAGLVHLIPPTQRQRWTRPASPTGKLEAQRGQVICPALTGHESRSPAAFKPRAAWLSTYKHDPPQPHPPRCHLLTQPRGPFILGTEMGLAPLYAQDAPRRILHTLWVPSMPQTQRGSSLPLAGQGVVALCRGGTDGGFQAGVF